MSTDAVSAFSTAGIQASVHSRRWLLPLLVTLFFATGISGLMYQVLWLRILTLTFGVTIYAVATVLSSFMAGLGLGSFLAGRLADRVQNPLRIYGLAEALVGLSGALTLVAFRLVHLVYVSLVPLLPSDSVLAISLLRALLAFGVLILPTSLMGATLPIIIKSSFFRWQGLSGNISLLYAVNTFGAMLGTFVAGFFLIGSIGIQASILLAATINLGAGLTAIAFSRFTRRAPPVALQAAAEATAEPAREEGYPRSVLLTVLMVFALSGFCSLAYEVVWTRILSLIFVATTYAFTLMLTTVLLGIAAGSYAINLVINRRGPWLFVFAAIELLVGLWALGSIELLSHVYGITARISAHEALAFLVAGDNRFIVFVSFLVMFPPMFLLGMTFPIAAKIFISSTTAIGERVGTIYAANVIGAIFGSFTAGFVFIPLLGSRDSLVLLAAINLGLGLLLLGINRRLPPLPKLAAGAALVLLGYTALFGPPLQQKIVAGRFAGETIWHKEGLETTVSIVREGNDALVLYLNGQHQANDTPDMVELHRLIGHLPLLLHPNPQRALAIGLGGGATPGAMSQHPGVQVDIVELSDNVVEAADGFFRHINYNLLQRPNVHLRVDDGRNYLLLTKQKYDVITADVIKPRNAGSANLYSVDYYRLARNALTDNGLMVIWLDPALPDYQYKLMIRTFLEVFPYATLWRDGVLIIGSKSPIQIDRARIERALTERETSRALAEDNIRSLQDVTALFVATGDELKAYVGPGPLITDDRPLIEYFRHLPSGGAPDRSRFSRDARAIMKP